MSSASAAQGKPAQTEHGRVTTWLQRLESPVTTYYVLLSVTAVLVIIGLIMVLSASAIVSYKNSDSSYTIFLRQMQFAIVGAIALLLVSRLSVSRWKSLGVPALLGAMGLQLLVFTPLFQHPRVHYLSGFFGPIERALRDQDANISFAPADFRSFAPLLEEQMPRVMSTAAAQPGADGWCSLSLHAGASIPELRRAA